MNECSALPDKLYSTFTPLPQRTDRQPHDDDDDDDDVLLAQVLLYRYDKARRGGQLIRKGHHSPATLLRISRRSVYPYLPRR